MLTKSSNHGEHVKMRSSHKAEMRLNHYSTLKVNMKPTHKDYIFNKKMHLCKVKDTWIMITRRLTSLLGMIYHLGFKIKI